ncbi:hypothetical protein KIPB_004106 [Kipferlia bialata]|uniref:Uncharacterized protein n=1 Tax=Kipferlia bialata TaxID=797122 RepID=A0A9K3CT91_9EUKA|nr:hypothetical protein KIPB_004106 [Kipferlia bialata]|eukprot:g4106.t1
MGLDYDALLLVGWVCPREGVKAWAESHNIGPDWFTHTKAITADLEEADMHDMGILPEGVTLHTTGCAYTPWYVTHVSVVDAKRLEQSGRLTGREISVDTLCCALQDNALMERAKAFALQLGCEDIPPRVYAAGYLN